MGEVVRDSHGSRRSRSDRFRSVVLAPHQMMPGVGALVVGVMLVVAVRAQASMLWWLFERNTHIVRGAAMNLITSHPKV
jgi:hypothetical protein